MLLLLKGQPGSGKSHLGRALCRHLRWPLIDKDLARSPCQPLVAGHLGIDWNQLSYDIMFSYCEAQLACGLSAVLDCPLARRSLYDRAAKLAAKVRCGEAGVVVDQAGEADDVGHSRCWRVCRRAQTARLLLFLVLLASPPCPPACPPLPRSMEREWPS